MLESPSPAEQHRPLDVSAEPADLSGAVSRPDPALARAVLTRLLDNGSPAELIAGLSEHPRLAELFGKDSRVAERYTIAEHTEMVLRQFDRYLAKLPLPEGITKEELRLVLALHDIGKSIPPDKEEQHRATIEVIESVRDSLPIGDKAWAIGKVLIDNDLVGDLIRSCTSKLATMEERKAIGELARRGAMTLEDLQSFAWLVKVDDMHPAHPRFAGFEAKLSDSTRWLIDKSGELGMPPADLLRLVEVFYQADTAAYTYDAVTSAGRRASPGLDFLFELDRDCDLAGGDPLLVVDARKGRLAFSYYVEKAVGQLEARVRHAEQARPADPAEAGRLMDAVSPERYAALAADVSGAKERLSALNGRLEEEAAALRAAIFERAAPELEAGRAELDAAEKRERSETLKALGDLADAAYCGRLGKGTLVLVGPCSGSRYGTQSSPVESVLLAGEKHALLRVVPLTGERSLPADLSTVATFELTSNGLIGSHYYHAFLSPHPEIVSELAAERWPGADRHRPALALVETGEISRREARDLFDRANGAGNAPDIHGWRRLLGADLLESILHPGDTLDMGPEGAVHWARIRACLLPSGRWAVLTPYVEAERVLADEYGDYRVYDLAHRPAGAAASPDSIPAAKVARDGKESVVAGLDPLSADELSFVASAMRAKR